MRGLSTYGGIMIKAIRPVGYVAGWRFADGMDAAIGWNGKPPAPASRMRVSRWEGVLRRREHSVEVMFGSLGSILG